MVHATVTAPARVVVREGPRFGLATATLVVVSSMIGTGVLTTPGFTVYFVGSNQLMLALWVGGGVTRGGRQRTFTSKFGKIIKSSSRRSASLRDIRAMSATGYSSG
jgi:hypothetical protein